MSKKKFKDGLESLFGGPAIAEPSLPENSPLLEKTEKKSSSKPKKTLKVKGKRSRTGKNFTSDLDTLFETVLESNLRESKENQKTNGSKAKRPPVVGLDALIQRTTDHDYDYTTTKKRVTFIFEKKKLDKLKRIAKLQNAYLKDIIGKIVGTHIDKYDEEGRPKS